MCNKVKNGDQRIDPCIASLVSNLRYALKEDHKLVASCCGHQKYKMTLVVNAGHGIYDLVSGVQIPRKRKFYKKDKEGFYYIPEVVEYYNKKEVKKK